MQPAVKSAIRAFEVLEAFERQRKALSLKDITEELGYPPSSGSALLKSLMEIGYLDYDQERRVYFPTLRVSQLGQWVEDAMFGDNDLRAAMEWLREQTGEGIILGAQSDINVRYLHILYSDRPLQFRGQPGMRRPIAQTALGLAILADKDDAAIEAVRRKINAYTDANLDRASLMEQVGQVRVRGYAFTKSSFTEGLGVIGMTLPTAINGRTMALGVAGYVSRLERNEEEIVTLLRQTGAKLAGTAN